MSGGARKTAINRRGRARQGITCLTHKKAVKRDRREKVKARYNRPSRSGDELGELSETPKNSPQEKKSRVYREKSTKITPLGGIKIFSMEGGKMTLKDLLDVMCDNEHISIHDTTGGVIFDGEKAQFFSYVTSNKTLYHKIDRVRAFNNVIIILF